ncbi:MAG: hypothetical protein KZQ83_02670 [gamma proteobacterium symbiont of Taylorina sp.]|nr:hypothetical protein [gamma proteobacterium symbiont of Taylorina sp.]
MFDKTLQLIVNCILLFFLLSPLSHAFEFSGKVGMSTMIYQHAPLYEVQHRQQASILSELEFYHDWNDAQDSLTFKPYIRIDQHDNKRSHFDIRELMWLHVRDNWELRTGIGKVFWGVNESNHLVDIINQDDQVDDINGEPKLGQPMINLSLIRDWGIIDFFILPGFRERTFPGEEGRLRGFLVVDTDHALYESSAGRNHTDFALRWNHTISDFDIGVSYFQGTNRDPRYKINVPGKPDLIPYYDQINQLGLDFQATLEGWLWKLEAIQRKDEIDNYTAVSGGFEYTINGIMDSSSDLGLIAEYSWDERNNPTLNQFQNDMMLGLRLGFNDAQSTEILAGWLQYLDYSELRSFQIEASRRLGDDWKFSLDLRIFSDNKINPIGNDDQLQLTLERYF